MRLLVLVLTTLLAACSRADADAIPQRHKTPDARLRALGEDARLASEPREPSHVFALPKGFGGNMVTGAQPSPEHPAGTVFLVGISPGAAGLTIGEWELASGNAVRRAVLSVPPTGDSMLSNQGGVLHLVGQGFDGPAYYLRLSPELKVLSRTRIDDLGGGGPHAVASDGRLTVIVAAYPQRDGTAGPCYAATYDEGGKRIAHRSLGEDGASYWVSNMADHAAVIGGKVYVLLTKNATDWGQDLHLVEYTSDLIPITSTVVPLPPEHTAYRFMSLHAHGDRLVVEASPVRYELSSDLAEMKESPLEATPGPQKVRGRWCDESVIVGSVHATLCYFPRERAEDPTPGPSLIAWDRYDGDP